MWAQSRRSKERDAGSLRCMPDVLIEVYQAMRRGALHMANTGKGEPCHPSGRLAYFFFIAS
jgi:hypothetical protein